MAFSESCERSMRGVRQLGLRSGCSSSSRSTLAGASIGFAATGWCRPRGLQIHVLGLQLLVVALCSQPASAGLLGWIFGSPPAAAIQYSLTKYSTALQTMCVGSQTASKATFAAPDYFIIGSTQIVQGYTTCTSTLQLMEHQPSGSYNSLSPLQLPLEWSFAGWQVSNWQAAPTDIVQLTIANRGLVPLLLSSLESLLSLLPFIGQTVVQGPASQFTQNFITKSAVQSYFLSLSTPPPANTLQAGLLIYPGSGSTTVAYVFYQADGTGAISFYFFEATFVPPILKRRRLLAAQTAYSTQGSTCQCYPNTRPAPSCKAGSSSYPGCRYICCC